MDSLPVEILIQVFENLDNSSMWNAMKVCKRWSIVFSDSPKLVDKFVLRIDKAFFKARNHINLPQVAIRNVAIDSLVIKEASSDAVNVRKLIDKYQHFIESITLSAMRLESVGSLRKVLEKLKKLKHFRAIDVCFTNSFECAPLILPDLKSIATVINEKLIENNEKIFELFKHNSSVEKFEFETRYTGCLTFQVRYPERELKVEPFNELFMTLPNLKHLVMRGIHAGKYFEGENFPIKLQRLEATQIAFIWYGSETGLEFVKSQVGSLQELKLDRLPLDYESHTVLKCILEEMKLDSFHYGDTPLILNGQKQPIEEIWFNEITIDAGMELLRQFPSVKKLRIELCANDLYEYHSLRSVDHHAFARLQELNLVDYGDRYLENLDITEIFMSCLNVRKLTIVCYCIHVNPLYECFRECLPLMTQLEEIWLDSSIDFRLDEKFDDIRESCLNLRKLKARAEHVEMALNAFDGSDVVIESL